MISGRYTGNGDGYLGFDFLKQYNAIIDFGENTLTLKLDEGKNQENETTKEEEKSNKTTEVKQKQRKDRKYYENREQKNEKQRHLNKEITNQTARIESESIRRIQTEIFNSFKNKIEEVKENGLIGFNEDDFDGNFEGKYISIYDTSKFETSNPKQKSENKINAIQKMKFNSNKNEREKPAGERSKDVYSKLTLDHCTEEERENIQKICNDFAMQFYMDGDILGCSNVIQHDIKLLPHAKPTHVRQYRIPHSHREVLKDMIDEYERQGLIEKCSSEFNSPLLLVAKKDDFGNKTDLRFVIDYRKLNEMTQMRIFPIPRIEDILDDLGGCEYFTTLDIKGAFHQIKLNKESRDLTAFTACGFQYRWKRMPMGLAMSPLTWQRAINTILQDIIGHGVYVYLDDIIIYAKTIEEHDKMLLEIMKILQHHNLQLKISKCTFYASEFLFLGHIISKDGVRTNPRKIEAVKNYPIPKNVKQIQSFLGFCNYY